MKNSKEISLNKMNIISIVLGYLLTLVIFKFFKVQFEYSKIVFLPAMFGTSILIKNSYKLISNKNICLGAAVFSAALSASFVIGRKINLFEKPYFEYFRFNDIIYIVLLGLFLFCVVINIVNFICKTELKIIPLKVNYKFWLIIFIIIVLAWLPYLLIYYPGMLSTDSYVTLNQCLRNMPYSNHHPIMFTMFVNVWIHLGLLLGDINFAIACFSFVQLLVLAGVVSYSVYWLKTKGIFKYILVLITMFFALNPVIAMYSITMWKDVMFAGWVLLLILFLYDIVESNGKLLCCAKGLCRLAIICLLVSFGRNNGFYVVVTLLVVLAVYFRKYYKLLLPVFISMILVIGIIQGPVYNLLGIKKGNFAEAIGIPLQQIGYTIEESGSVKESHKEILNNILPVEIISDIYKPYSPDYIKFNPDFDNKFVNNNKGEFIKVWLGMLPHNFNKYVKAWLMQTKGYYHIGTTNWVVCESIVDKNNLGIFNTNFFEKVTGKDFRPIIKCIINKITYYPLVENIYSIASMVWLTFLGCLVMIFKKRYKYIISLVPLLALWGTMMIAAPTFCEFRYMFSFHLTLPFLILILFIKDKKEKRNDNEQNERIIFEK